MILVLLIIVDLTLYVPNFAQSIWLLNILSLTNIMYDLRTYNMSTKKGFLLWEENETEKTIKDSWWKTLFEFGSLRKFEKSCKPNKGKMTKRKEKKFKECKIITNYLYHSQNRRIVEKDI